MGKHTRITVVLLCAGLFATTRAQAQRSDVHWYFGAQAGFQNFGTATDGRKYWPMGGIHFLVAGKRAGLLISAEEAFGGTGHSSYGFVLVDSVGTVISSGDVPVQFDGVRKISAVLIGYPAGGGLLLRPYLGVGVGLQYLDHMAPETPATSHLGHNAFGTLLAGVEFKLLNLVAFGQYQIVSRPVAENFVTRFQTKETLFENGPLVRGPTHNITAGVRFDFGRANGDEDTRSGY